MDVLTLPPPLDARATLRRFLLPALVCTALLTAGYLRTAPGAPMTAPWGYRTWSFGALAYSDIIALHDDRGGGRHAVPFFQDRIEYPVLLALGMWWPSVVEPDRAGYFALTYAALSACALAVLWLLCAMPRSSPWAFAASPALLVYAPLNWDLFGLFPLALGLYLWARGRDRAAALSLSLAVWTKMFPVLALGVFGLVSLRKGLKQAAVAAGIFAAVSVALNLPFALAGGAVRDNWLWFFRYSNLRELEPSLYLLAGRDARGFVGAANAISALTVLAGALALAAVELRTRRLSPLHAFCALVCLFFLVNKVYSPQYWLWVVCALAFAQAPGWLSAAVGAVALADFVSSFSFLHLQMERAGRQVEWFSHALFWPTVSLRYATLAGCALWAAARSAGARTSHPEAGRV